MIPRSQNVSWCHQEVAGSTPKRAKLFANLFMTQNLVKIYFITSITSFLLYTSLSIYQSEARTPRRCRSDHRWPLKPPDQATDPSHSPLCKSTLVDPIMATLLSTIQIHLLPALCHHLFGFAQSPSQVAFVGVAAPLFASANTFTPPSFLLHAQASGGQAECPSDTAERTPAARCRLAVPLLLLIFAKDFRLQSLLNMSLFPNVFPLNNFWKHDLYYLP